jgi:hypothetical protein
VNIPFPAHYDKFLTITKEFIMPEKSKADELRRSFWIAVELFHETMMEREAPIRRNGRQKAPTTLVHNDKNWGNCEVCKEMLEEMKILY